VVTIVPSKLYSTVVIRVISACLEESILYVMT